MSSATLERLVGAQRPRIDHVPRYATSTGPEAVALAAKAGLILDDWQQYLLTCWLGETAGGKWSASTIGLMVSRQNGKGALLEARELAGLFLLEEPVIVHTAHLQDTANVHFRRLVERIKDTPELEGRLAKPGGILRGHGTETIQLSRNPETGVAPRLEVRTRTGSGGLGFSINLLVFDEAMIISDPMHQALVPTLSAQSIGGNLQRIYTGSAVDEDNPSHQGIPFARVREQGIAGAPGTMYSEWSLDLADPAEVNLASITDEELRATNPGAEIRIGLPYIRQDEIPALGARGTAVQRLGVGLWPRTDGLEGVVIMPDEWVARTDAESKITGPVCLAIDVDPARKWCSVAAAGFRADGKPHVEMIERRRGTGWALDYMLERVDRHPVIAVLIDGRSPANSLREGLAERLPVGKLRPNEITVLTAVQHAEACGMFFDAVQQDRLRHIGQPELAEALRGATKRPLTDAWAWSRINSTVDISPLVACTLALWGSEVFREGVPRVWV